MIRKFLFVILLCAAIVGCRDTFKGEALAEAQIPAFHDRLNAKRFEEIYITAGDEFRSAATKENALALFAAVQKKLGKVRNSSTTKWNVRTFNFVTTVVLVVDTDFEQGKGTETFTFRVSGDTATLVGYNINSLDMMTR